MVSILAIPEQRSTTTTRVELKPSQTRQWLAKLPLLDTQDTLTQIFDALHELNRVPAKPGTRLRLLELYRTPISFIGQHVEKTLAESYLPLAEKHAKLAELCELVSVEMAYGYKSVVLDLAKGHRSSRPQGDLCTAIHRAIRYLTFTLHQSGVYYNSYPPGTWVEIHSLFKYGRKLGIENNQVKDALNQPKPKNSISHAYNQALLFGLSDCYHHPVNITGKVHRYLDRWASDAVVAKYTKPETTRCQFVVDPSQDRAPTPYSESEEPKKTKHLLMLDTRVVTRNAHTQWHKLRAGSTPKSVGLDEDFLDDNGLDMLERVVLAWGIAPRRRYPRNPISGPYQLAIGISSTNYFLNGERTFKCVSEDAARPTTGTFGLHQIHKREESHATQNWLGFDESIHGLSLHVNLSQPAAIQVRVGEVVAIRPDRDNAAWSPALIRWVRIIDTELRVGLQRLGAGAKPVAVKPMEVEGAEDVFKISIQLPKHDVIQQQQSLITPPGLYMPKRNLIIDDGTKLSMVRAGKAQERSRYFEWFDYEERSSSPSETVTSAPTNTTNQDK